MALTYSNRREGVDVQGRRTVEVDVTFDASYPTGGEVVDRNSIGLREVRNVELIRGPIRPDKDTSARTTHGRQVDVDFTDPTAPKLVVYTANDTEAGAGTDQSQIVERIRFVGA